MIYRERLKKFRLTLTMGIQDKSDFENSVDPDQLASKKPADQDQHCFQLCLYIHAKYRNPAK